MKKVALAVLLMATTAFAAPSLVAPAQVDGSSGTAVVVLSIDNDADLFGYSLKGILPAGLATVSGRENLIAASGISDPTRTDGQVIGQDLANVPDLGFTGIPFDTAFSASGDFLRLTLTVDPGTLPFDVNWEAAFVGTFLDEYPVSVATTTIVPEPASMSLLALGAAFFARRRRA